MYGIECGFCHVASSVRMFGGMCLCVYVRMCAFSFAADGFAYIIDYIYKHTHSFDVIHIDMLKEKKQQKGKKPITVVRAQVDNITNFVVVVEMNADTVN